MTSKLTPVEFRRYFQAMRTTPEDERMTPEEWLAYEQYRTSGEVPQIPFAQMPPPAEGKQEEPVPEEHVDLPQVHPVSGARKTNNGYEPSPRDHPFIYQGKVWVKANNPDPDLAPKFVYFCDESELSASYRNLGCVFYTPKVEFSFEVLCLYLDPPLIRSDYPPYEIPVIPSRFDDVLYALLIENGPDVPEHPTDAQILARMRDRPRPGKDTLRGALVLMKDFPPDESNPDRFTAHIAIRGRTCRVTSPIESVMEACYRFMLKHSVVLTEEQLAQIEDSVLRRRSLTGAHLFKHNPNWFGPPLYSVQEGVRASHGHVQYSSG